MPNINLDVHQQYAKGQADLEKWSKDYKMAPSQTGGIAGQTKILDLAPKYPALTSLLQTNQRVCWSGVKPPENYFIQKTDSYRIAPSLGSGEKIDANIAKIQEAELTHGVQPQAPEGKLPELDDLSSSQNLTDGQKLINVNLSVRDMNELIDYARGRMGQFLQG